MLLHGWQTACDGWKDGVQQRFGQEFMDAFSTIMPEALKEIDRLANVIDQARREVK
jgi:hypothetical protein